MIFNRLILQSSVVRKVSIPRLNLLRLLPGIGLLVVGLFLGCSSSAPSEPGLDPVTRILQKYTVVDPAVTTRFFRFPGEPENSFHPEELTKAGIDVAGLGIGSLTEILITGDFGPYLYQSPEPGNLLSRSVFEGAAATKRFLWEVDSIYQAVAQHPDRMAVALTAEDIERFRSQGRLSLLIGLDSGVALEDLATLRIYQRLGLRKLELVHSFPFQWADSSVGIVDDDDPGLEDFGLEVVRECNRLGILVDISHGSDQTMWDALETSTRPLIASHSGARAVVDAHRNLTDEMLQALANNGGMIGVGAYYDPELLEPIRVTGTWTATSQIHNHLAGKHTDPFDLAAALRSPAEKEQARKALELSPPSPLAQVVPRSGVLTEGSNVQGTLDHIDHIVALIGIDHVGIGTDIDIGREDYIWLYRQLVQGLLDRNYTDEQIGRILGGNFLRVLRANTQAEVEAN